MAERRLAAIMFTDIVGYTALMGKDEKKAFDILKKNRRIHWRLIKKYKGRWLKEMGDGILASFPSNIDAVMCAVSIQTAAKEMGIPLRIGIHQGDVIFEKKDVLGDGVNIASRIQAVANSNDIVISEKVYSDIRNKEGLEIEFAGRQSLKGVEGETSIYKVYCADSTVLDFEVDSGELVRPLGLGIRTIFAGIAILVLLTFSLFYFLPKIFNPPPEIEKSIAVLPFFNASSDTTNAYFVDGVIEDIRTHLEKISDLRITSRTSTEKYRGTSLTAREIAEELNVKYLLEGTIQKQGNIVKIHAQLILAETDDHIWSEPFERDLSDLEKYFKVQSEIAQTIAGKIHVNITPEEKEIIEKVPTTSLAAYDYFLQAEEKFQKSYLHPGISGGSMRDALSLYRRVLEYDSTYAKVYARLAYLYYIQDWGRSALEETYMDSILVLANIGLSYDENCAEAYVARGHYYMIKGNADRGLQEFEKALDANPNFAEAYKSIGAYSFNLYGKVLVGLENLHKAYDLKDYTVSIRNDILFYLANLYMSVGYFDRSEQYRIELLQFNKQDSMWYYDYYSFREATLGNIDKAIFWEEKALALSPGSLIFELTLGELHSFIKQYERSYFYFQKWERPLKNWRTGIIINRWIWVGYTYWLMGNQKEAEFWFNRVVDRNLRHIELKNGKEDNCDLARVYALQGDLEKAYYYLDKYNTGNFKRYGEIVKIKRDPFFDNIRDEERFKVIVRDMEEKYRKKREMVTVWLEEKNML